MRLLLADDERELSRALEAVLKHSNYSVDVVNNGADAMDYALSGNYDGLILDIMMPKKNGLEVVRELRERGIPTPVLSVAVEQNDTVVGESSGMGGMGAPGGNNSNGRPSEPPTGGNMDQKPADSNSTSGNGV